jgi:hypothetical protein
MYWAVAGMGPLEFVFHEQIVVWMENKEII